jgi:hypothetical protein
VQIRFKKIFSKGQYRHQINAEFEADFEPAEKAAKTHVKKVINESKSFPHITQRIRTQH